MGASPASFPAAFDIVTRAVDQGLPIDAPRIGERMEAALAISVLPGHAGGGNDTQPAWGQLRLVDPVVACQGGELTP